MTPEKNPASLPGPRRVGFVDDFKRFFIRGPGADPADARHPLAPGLGLEFPLAEHRTIHHQFASASPGTTPSGRSGSLPNHATTSSRNWTTAISARAFSAWCCRSCWSIFIGVFVGNLIGRTFWRIAERALLRIPLVRAIYPAVKQVTDFVLADRAASVPGQPGRRRSAARAEYLVDRPGHQHAGNGSWAEIGPEEMMTVFVPSTPTSFSGYVLVVPRSKVIELPMTVEEAMRLLVSGGRDHARRGQNGRSRPP